ncbi:GntR family transcriptional regulator [Mesorhizobium sp. NBSH29]|uniref:GntR family transcriptional regulator n=1 Tax=Mesorhizobium sp. NBSH29 TaxID=2654249 RepID=UPI0018968777|nr:GntR family transcriptional regulator [Mesorhizobium sp. NBSH29]QPC85746.1 GntR family transcriptional regulator [Mesorhizobium sp. NBSH29]
MKLVEPAIPKSESAFEAMRRDIVSGVLAPGQPLRMAYLQKLYGLGATPIREALSRLEEKRMAVLVPNRGYTVAPVSLAELEDLELARETVECALLEDAIAHGDTQWEAEIVAAHYSLSRCAMPIGSNDAGVRLHWVDIHDGFHRRLVAAARSSWLKSFQDQTLEQLQRHHQALLFHPDAVNPERPSAHDPAMEAMLRDVLALEPHTRLMQATLDRDTAAASTLLRAHIRLALDLHRAISGTKAGTGTAPSPLKRVAG